MAKRKQRKNMVKRKFAAVILWLSILLGNTVTAAAGEVYTVSHNDTQILQEDLSVSGNETELSEEESVDIPSEENLKLPDEEPVQSEDGLTVSHNELTVSENELSALSAKQDLNSLAADEIKIVLSKVNRPDGMGIEAVTKQELEALKETAVSLGEFPSLQQAFSEIDRLNRREEYYYLRVKGDDSISSNYSFPTKAAGIFIEGEGDNIRLSYKSDLTIKTDVWFERLILAPASALAKLNLGNFRMVLSDTDFEKSGEAEKKISVVGSSLTGSSWLRLNTVDASHKVELTFASISNLGTLQLSGVDAVITGAAKMNTLKMGNETAGDEEVFTGLGRIEIKNIITEGKRTIRTLPGYTFNKDEIGSIKTVTPRLTITGRVEITDYRDKRDALIIDILLDSDTRLESSNAKITALLEKSGLPLAKAINADTGRIIYGGSDEATGEIYKKAGTLVYRLQKAPLSLSYNLIETDASARVTAQFESFKDAVTEINNLKTKRAYTITFHQTEADSVPEVLTMPLKQYISHLTLNADGNRVYYQGNITFTSDVTLENIHFVQAKVVRGVTVPVEELSSSAPAPVTISTGGFRLQFKTVEGEENRVSFNTPILLNGGGKGVFELDQHTVFSAGENIFFSHLQVEEGLRGRSIIRGKIANFAQVDLKQNVQLLGWPTMDAKTNKESYNAAELNVAALSVSETGSLAVGAEGYADKVTVKTLKLDSSRMAVTGSGSFTNIYLTGRKPELSVKSPLAACDEEGNVPPLTTAVFTISGTLKSSAEGALLETGLNSKAEAALTISGKAILEKDEWGRTHQITIKVSVSPAHVGDEGTTNGLVKLGETILRVKEKNKTVEKTLSSLLLRGKNLDERVFQAHGESVFSENEATDLPYGETATEGYILKKGADGIRVYYGNQVGAALYTVEEGKEEESLFQYYPTLADAITAIDQIKNSKQSYKIELQQDVGKRADTEEITPVKITLPRYANQVTIVSGGSEQVKPKTIYINGGLTLRCNITIDQVRLLAVKKQKTGYTAANLSLNTGNYCLTLKNMPTNRESGLLLSGTEKGTAALILADNSSESNPVAEGVNLIQARGLGKLIFYPMDPGAKADSISAVCEIQNGISGVGTLEIKPGVTLKTAKEVSVSNLIMGEGGDTDSGQSVLEAKNITVNQAAQLTNSYLKAGTDTTGDGKLTLNHVVLGNQNNYLVGKQDKKGNTLIQVKGRVTGKISQETAYGQLAESVKTSRAAITVGLMQHNSAENFVRLREGMALLTAPKAASSWFVPYYAKKDSRGEQVNMGEESLIQRKYEDGTIKTEPLCGTYKSANAVKYGRLLEILKENGDGTADAQELTEVRLWIGTDEGDRSVLEKEFAYSGYMTFEEAVAGIGNMGVGAYTLELLRDVEIGNVKKDGRYSALTLPVKATNLTIVGEEKAIRFSGNVTLRSSTRLEEGISLIPMQMTKSGVQEGTTNLSLANYTLVLAGARLKGLNNITGGVKGMLKFEGQKTIPDLELSGSLKVKTILSTHNANARLVLSKGLTANLIGLTDGGKLTLQCPTGMGIKLNGAAAKTVDSKADHPTQMCSVYSETGAAVTLQVMDEKGSLAEGAKLITGKYLNPNQWVVNVLQNGQDTVKSYSIMLRGNALYLDQEK